MASTRAFQPFGLMRRLPGDRSLGLHVADAHSQEAGAKMLSPSQAAMYRRLTLGDESLMNSLFQVAGGTSDVLDDRTVALIRLAALIAVDADTPAYQAEVRCAIAAGVSPEQITDVLVVIARVAGSAAVMSAAPKLALALGYDVDDGLENASSREGEQ